MNKFLLLTLAAFSGLLYSAATFAQEDDESCVEPDKKTMKLLKVGENPKSDRMDRIMAYTDAVKAVPDNAYIYYSFACYNYSQAEEVQYKFDEGKTNFKALSNAYMAAANAYKKSIEFCPEFHSDSYYKIGYIYRLLGEKGQSMNYFDKFLAFKSDDPNAYGPDYAKNKKDIEDLLPEIEFFEKFYANTVPYEPTKVLNVSTSDKQEYLPMISPDNDLIFYTRKGKVADGGVMSAVIEAFTMSVRPNTKSDFDGGTALRAPFNTPQHNNYGGVSMSLDNKEMFICACEEVDYQNHANCDIYVTKFEKIDAEVESRERFKWSPLKKLGPEINTKDGWEAQPALSADGHTLYFATWRDGSQLTDIYFSKRGKDGKWSQAKPVPGRINSEGHDKAPFIHQDSETMYFVSECSPERLGAGGTDVFYTRLGDDGKWKDPKNLGFPINTAGNEVGMVVSTDGHLAYFTTAAKGGTFDIYNFELYKDARPQKVLFVKGEVKDDKGEPVKDAKVEIAYKDSGKSFEVNVNGDDGKFAAIVKLKEDEEEDVMIVMKKDGASFDTKLIKAEEIKTTIEKKETFIEDVEMEIEEIKVGESFTMDNILYNTKSYTLDSDGKFVLDQFVKFLKSNPTVKVSIQGHTDNKGNPGENKTLSLNRAKGVMAYIISKGIDGDRLKSEGFGQSQPKVPNDTDANRAQNRRTDIFIREM